MLLYPCCKQDPAVINSSNCLKFKDFSSMFPLNTGLLCWGGGGGGGVGEGRGVPAHQILPVQVKV